MPYIIKYKHFRGQHCETNATGNLLAQAGVRLSEPMLFGLGEGLGFIFLNLSSLNLPLLGGRSKPFELTARLCENLGVNLQSSETSSEKKSLSTLVEKIEAGQCVGLQLDSFHLDYFTSKIHFAGHALSVFGLEDQSFHVSDTKQQGGDHVISFEDISKARHEKGPMSARARSWTLEVENREFNFENIVHKAVTANAKTYLQPKFKGMSHLGIEKLVHSLPKWIQNAKSPKEDLMLSAVLMEKAGTGGAIFRNFYRDFLKESHDLIGAPPLSEAHTAFKEIAKKWTKVATLIERTAETLSEEHLVKAAEICSDLAKQEKAAMEGLAAWQE